MTHLNVWLMLLISTQILNGNSAGLFHYLAPWSLDV